MDQRSFKIDISVLFVSLEFDRLFTFLVESWKSMFIEGFNLTSLISLFWVWDFLAKFGGIVILSSLCLLNFGWGNVLNWFYKSIHVICFSFRLRFQQFIQWIRLFFPLLLGLGNFLLNLCLIFFAFFFIFFLAYFCDIFIWIFLALLFFDNLLSLFVCFHLLDLFLETIDNASPIKLVL